jgi:PTS system sucrose-specific IIC component
MDYKKTARQICQRLGGRENLQQVNHCATRLRVTVKNPDKVDLRGLKNIKEVTGVVRDGEDLQIIVGPGVVNRIYNHLALMERQESSKAAGKKKSPVYWLKRGIKKMGDIFIPILPVLVAAGFLKGIVDLLGFMNLHGILGIGIDNSIYLFAKLFSNSVYEFMSILIAFSAARVFGGNPYLGAVIGMIMLNPDLQSAWSIVAEGVEAYQSVFGGLYKVPMMGYQGHVIPIIIAVWIMSALEKFLHKKVPPILDLFVTPLASLFISGYLAFAIVGPVFLKIEDILLLVVRDLIMAPYGIGGFFMGGLYSATVVTGVHHMYTVVELGQLAKYGFNYMNPIASAAAVAQGGAALAMAFKLKNRRLKGIAIPSACSAFIGITEPALFGVNLRYMRPFFAAALGGACGGWYASLRSLGAVGIGVSGIFAFPLYLHDPADYLICLLISLGVSFLLAWVMGGQEENLHITAPVQGELIPLAEVNDPTFRKGVLGPGIAFHPTQGKVVAPMDGKIEAVLKTGHAVILSGRNGAEILIHVGINTVNLEGRYFSAKVIKGDKVKRGDVLVEFERESIEREGFDVTTPMILVNAEKYDLTLTRAPGAVKKLDEVMLIE